MKLFAVSDSLRIFEAMASKLFPFGFSQIYLTFGLILARLSKDKVNFSLPSLLQNLEYLSLIHNFVTRYRS
jgi:hypothetical protein